MARPRPDAAQARADGRAVLVAGATGSGKTLYAAALARAARRLLVWDVEGQWPALAGCRLARDAAELLALARDRRVTRIAYRGTPTAADFEWFCRVAWAWALAAPGLVIVEELADVTSPGKAPPAWGLLVRRGRKYGLDLVAITQRPAESDKTILGNAAAVVCLRMSRALDRAYMARELDVAESRVAALAPLHYLRRDLLTGTLTAGRVTPPRR